MRAREEPFFTDEMLIGSLVNWAAKWAPQYPRESGASAPNERQTRPTTTDTEPPKSRESSVKAKKDKPDN